MSLHSSGVLIEAHDRDRHCDTCDWEGVVEVIDDPEIREAWWKCRNPDCRDVHTEAL